MIICNSCNKPLEEMQEVKDEIVDIGTTVGLSQDEAESRIKFHCLKCTRKLNPEIFAPYKKDNRYMKENIEDYMQGTRCLIEQVDGYIFHIQLFELDDIAEIADLQHCFQNYFHYECKILQFDTLEVKRGNN